jgi:hypothetical protein
MEHQLMKYHKQVWRSIDLLDSTPEAAIAAIEKASEGLVEPEVDTLYDYEWRVVGWEPMTAEEIKKADARSAAAKKARKIQLEKKKIVDIARARKVLAKYGELDG